MAAEYFASSPSLSNAELSALVLERLLQRNKKENGAWSRVVNSNAKLLETILVLKAENQHLTDTAARLRDENSDLRLRKESSGYTEEQLQNQIKVTAELNDLLREKGERNQMIINLQNQIKDLERTLNSKDSLCAQKEDIILEMQKVQSKMEAEIDELSATNQMLKDEQQALQLAFVSLEEKFRKNQEEYNELVKRVLEKKSLQADEANKELESFNKAKQAKIQQQLNEAMQSEVVRIRLPPPCFAVSLPSKVLHSFDAHDGEVNAIKWSPSGRVFATAGSDRRVKLWELINYRCEPKGMLTGSNAGVMSLDFDFEECMLLGASNDFASHIWGIDDQRQRHTLTGHSNKVQSAKFLGEPSKVASGSHDRTIKLWDLHQRACVKTLFAGSSCHDLVASYGSQIISGHFDKRVRFWDQRTDNSTNEIQLPGKITSLDSSPDRNKLLCCTRENSLKLIDLRMSQVISTFSATNFSVATDYCKAVFSPDGEYVCAGSSDGTVYIWNITKNKVETTIKEHSHAVIACHWHPQGNMLLTCDRQKKVILWSDF